ncbi:MAG: hypothetical protein R3B95_10180 [Nitrospirales bacterium]|nr:hypothetical protein [Nitrospirales bacterium]
MDLSVRTADLEVDKPAIIEMLYHYLTPASNNERFEWLYTKNPFGPALTWLGLMRGQWNCFRVASAFPRRGVHQWKNQRGLGAWGFCVHEQYRSLGPAIQLQRACLAGIDSDHSGMWYDFPSSSMMAIYQRLRVPFFQNSVLRLAKPIRVDRKVRAYLKALLQGRRLLQISILNYCTGQNPSSKRMSR